MHDLYDPETNDYDVAVLKLEQNIKFGYNVLPILLDDGLTITDVEKTVGVVSGWGATAFNGDASTTSLLKTTVPLVTTEKCRAVYASIGNITERMLCAGNGESDSCQGDSGGKNG
jgi:secreted trypsin-like serine protease